MQFRYYGYEDKNNYPPNDVLPNMYGKLVSGNILRDYGIVSHLGIQGIPGTEFYLNDGQHPIYIGDTGIYEIDLEDRGQISRIRFSEKSLSKYEDEDYDEVRLLIDIVYEGAGVNT